MDITLVVGRKQLFPASNGSFRMMTTNHVRDMPAVAMAARRRVAATIRIAAAAPKCRRQYALETTVASTQVHGLKMRPEESPLSKLQLEWMVTLYACRRFSSNF